MKKRIEIEATFCDVCNRQDCATACMECRAEFCYECRKVKGVEYKHAVYFSGSGDGFYCIPCDQRLSELRNNPRHLAYQAIRDLVDEAHRWSANFDLRRQVAEDEVKRHEKT